jgi:superfamily II DNA or RNA helicase
LSSSGHALPRLLSFKGKLVQYVGRVLRSHQAKTSVRVYDYVDTQVPILRKMYAKRQKTYRSLGFASEKEQASESFKKTSDPTGIPTELFRSGSYRVRKRSLHPNSQRSFSVLLAMAFRPFPLVASNQDAGPK